MRIWWIGEKNEFYEAAGTNELQYVRIPHIEFHVDFWYE